MKTPLTLKLLAVADVIEPHLYDISVKERLPGIELVISCGDLPSYYLDFLVTNLGAPLIHVIGNHCGAVHENGQKCAPSAYPGALNLHGRLTTMPVGDRVTPLLVGGLEGSPRYNRGPHQYTEQEAAIYLLRMVPGLMLNKARYGRYLDILITHTPPRGIHDNEDIAHRGFTSLLPFLDFFKPALMLHGHTHRYDPTLPMRTRYKQTEVVNAYGYTTLDLCLEAASRRDVTAPRWMVVSKANQQAGA